LTALTDGFRSVKQMTAARHLQLKEVTLIEFIVGPFNVVAMLVLAWAMRSVYALAIAAALSGLLQTVLSYVMLKGPASRFRWDASAARAILHFGKWVFLSTLITFLAMQIDRLTMAGMFPLAQVGVYSIAASLAVIVPTLVGKVQLSVLFPWYSRMIEQGMSLPEAFGRTRNAMMVLTSFLCALLMAGAASFFDLAYDNRYAMGGLLLPLLALGAWFSCLETMYGAVFVASGRPQWIAATNAVKVASFALLLVPLFALQLDILTAAVFLAGSEVLRWLVCQSLGRRLELRNARAEVSMLLFLLAVSLAGWWLVQWAPVVSELAPFWRLTLLGVFETVLFAPLLHRFVLPLVRRRS
jgi:O-antigen/teichoic acid export membrane protein